MRLLGGSSGCVHGAKGEEASWASSNEAWAIGEKGIWADRRRWRRLREELARGRHFLLFSSSVFLTLLPFPLVLLAHCQYPAMGVRLKVLSRWE